MESKKQLILVLGVVFCALILYVAIRIFSEDDEARIRKIIYAASLAIERQDLAGLQSFVSDSYQDAYGHDKAKLGELMVHFFKKFHHMRVNIKHLRIEAEKTEAQADIGFKCYFNKTHDARNYYDAGKLDVRFIKENQRWKVQKIEFMDSGELLFIQNVA